MAKLIGALNLPGTEERPSSVPHSYKIGSVLLPVEGGAFVITKVNKVAGRCLYRLASPGKEQLVTESELKSLPLITAGQRVIANLFKYMVAFNKDFDLYVKTAIREHNLPVDDRMDWSKWFEVTYRTKVSPRNEELRDEAIHHVLIHNLFEYDALAKFNPAQLNPEVAKRPLKEQITSYLKQYFRYQISDAVEYLKSVYKGDKELTILDSDPTPDSEPNSHATRNEFLNNSEYGQVDPETEEFWANGEIGKIRPAFYTYVDRIATDKMAAYLKAMFDLIVKSGEPKPKDIMERFMTQFGVGKPRAAQILYTELPKYMQNFAKANEGQGFELTKTIQNHPVRSNLEDTQMRDKVTSSFKERLAELKAKKMKKAEGEVELETSQTDPVEDNEAKGTPTAWSVDNERDMPERGNEKYATFRQVAAETPADMSDALIEITGAFRTLAECGENMVENLDLSPITHEASVRDKIASRRKFASRLKKLAEEDPAKVEGALMELYTSVDEIAAAIENLAGNLGFELPEVGGEVEQHVEEPLLHEEEIVVEDAV
jgi:hypothetical protein